MCYCVHNLAGCLQGASVAAVLCALQQERGSKPVQPGGSHGCWRHGHPDGCPSYANPANARLRADCMAESGFPGRGFGFRFAIMCSGYMSPAPKHAALHARVGRICLPSLHVYGAGQAAPEPSCPSIHPNPQGLPVPIALAGEERSRAETVAGVYGSRDEAGVHSSLAQQGDAQVSPAESACLVELFDPGAGRAVVRHSAGHLVPATRVCVEAYRAFLQRFVGSTP